MIPLKDKHIEAAEEIIRRQEEIDVAVQEAASAVADYYQTLISKGVGEIPATMLTSVWMSATLNDKQ